MMDRLALSAIEAAFHAGYPPEAGAVLLVEVDGLLEQVEAQAAVVDAVCRAAGALEIRLAATADERARLWAARKGAASAMGRIAPNYYLHDAVVPRTQAAARSWRRWSRSASATTCPSPTCSTPAMATCTR